MTQAANPSRNASARKRRLLLTVGLLALAGGVCATNYTLWIHGRNGGGVVGNDLDFTYWGPDTANAGVNKRSINWDGFNRISASNGRIRDALDCYCTGSNWCYIAAHSAGDNQIGYALALYGGTVREVKNASPNSAGTCSGSGGTQTGWNIKWVGVAGGSGGGTELANYGAWAVSDPLTADLKTTTARAMYDHNQTRDKVFYMYAGARGTSYSALLPGQDDEVVAYHSSGGVAGSSGGSYCNPADWFCNYLSLGPGPNEGGSTKWSNHHVSFRDDGKAYNHYTQRNWAGVVSRLRADMQTQAQ
jgi:hypothetical protein